MRIIILLFTFIIIFIFLCVYGNITKENFLVGENRPHFLDDKLFQDVLTFDNDEDGRLGLDKCLESNCGICVEYGLTGNAICFPKKTQLNKNTNTIILNWNNQVDRNQFYL